MTDIFVTRSSSRIRAAAICLLVALFPAMQAMALTLGDLVVHSVPGEPLKAIIPITLLPDEAFARIKVGLAPAEEYQRQKLERPASLEGVRAVLLAKGENAGRIQLYGEQPWQGEEAILLLQLEWPGGELNQRYRIVPVDEKAATPLYVEVAQDESLADIAIRLSKHSNRSYFYMMVALFRANPDAFYRGNLNYLKAGARLRVPSDEELYQLSEAEVTTTLREHEQRMKGERQQSAEVEQHNRELKEELARVKERSAGLEQNNKALKKRLARLEEQVNQMSQQVLEYAAQPGNKEVVAPVEVESAEKSPTDEGLSAWQMLLLLLLALVSVVVLRHFAPRRNGGDA